jgi:hypothetical protein
LMILRIRRLLLSTSADSHVFPRRVCQLVAGESPAQDTTARQLVCTTIVACDCTLRHLGLKW